MPRGSSAAALRRRARKPCWLRSSTRAVGRGGGRGRACTVSRALRALAEFGPFDRRLQLLELVVQRPRLLAVSDAERGEARLNAGDFRESGVERRFNRAEPRTEILDVLG